MEIKPGTKIKDRFEIRQHVEAGGYGQVWEGYDIELKRPIALKRLLRTTLGKVDKTEIVLEAQRIAAMNHPNIVAVYDVIEAPDDVLIPAPRIAAQSPAFSIQKFALAFRFRGPSFNSRRAVWPGSCPRLPQRRHHPS